MTCSRVVCFNDDKITLRRENQRESVKNYKRYVTQAFREGALQSEASFESECCLENLQRASEFIERQKIKSQMRGQMKYKPRKGRQGEQECTFIFRVV